MTENKAIEKIKYMPIKLFDDEGDLAKRMAIQALEKQIPMKPCNISETDDNDNAMVECPICHANNDYAINTIKSGYCWKCGQKLDWGNE